MGSADAPSGGFVLAGVVDGVVPFILPDRRALLIFATAGAFRDGSIPVYLDMRGADLQWLNSGHAPVLVDHIRTTDCVVGVVEAAWVKDDATALAVVRFGASSRATEAWADVQAGVLCNVSMGFAMSGLTQEREGAVFVKRWQPFELSLCALPKCLDAHVKVRGLSHEDARAFYAERDRSRAAAEARAVVAPLDGWGAWVASAALVLAGVTGAPLATIEPVLARLMREELACQAAAPPAPRPG